MSTAEMAELDSLEGQHVKEIDFKLQASRKAVGVIQIVQTQADVHFDFFEIERTQGRRIRC